ncbi:MAG: patatin-like phospholipase family protein [Burkholderiales bacterium]|nr:patatin-like phospholipase family protein [Burkholderiales bacterium]
MGRVIHQAAQQGLLALLVVIPVFLSGTAWAADPVPQAEPGPKRPRIGLVLSGGGARGLTHVGVLKVLERERIPVDVIAGTSMGAIIGGLYASGMSAGQIEHELLKVDWDKLFATRVSRQQLSQRRKEEDFEIASAIELGYRNGEFHAPQGAVSSRGLESMLRYFTLPVRQVERFDDLPIPFRAIATDMESGDMVVIDHGDLAMALRSSMSVPGVFPSTERDGRVLGDGGLVNNVPIDVARAMGADVVIVVNIGTPLAPRETLNSAIGLTAQMINILTEQNVRRSLATLKPTDILIAPNLGRLTSGDFGKTPELIALGEDGAHAFAARLAAFALPEAQYAGWREAHRPQAATPQTIQALAFEGTSFTNPKRFESQLQSRVGEPFDATKAARDARTLAASGDYVRTDYHVIDGDNGAMLLFDLEDKPWGPNYLRAGLDLSTDFSGRSAFNVKLSLNRHWLTASGTEWRNRVQIGEVPGFYTELYHPLNWNLGLWDDWFVSGHASASRHVQSLFQSDAGAEVGQVRQSDGRFGLDLGQPWGNLGEVRYGLVNAGGRTTPLLFAASYTGTTQGDTWRETAARARVVVDQLDFANFPQRGYRLVGELQYGRHVEASSQNLFRLEAEGLGVVSRGPHSFSLYGQIKASDARNSALAGQYELGGFQQLSGYRLGQVAGNAVALARLGWYQRLADTPVFARGFFVGATLEAGNGWADRRQMSLSGLRTGASLYLGADTGIGPMFLGLTWAPKGETGLALFIGRP